MFNKWQWITIILAGIALILLFDMTPRYSIWLKGVVIPYSPGGPCAPIFDIKFYIAGCIPIIAVSAIVVYGMQNRKNATNSNESKIAHAQYGAVAIGLAAGLLISTMYFQWVQPRYRASKTLEKKLENPFTALIPKAVNQ